MSTQNGLVCCQKTTLLKKRMAAIDEAIAVVKQSARSAYQHVTTLLELLELDVQIFQRHSPKTPVIPAKARISWRCPNFRLRGNDRKNVNIEFKHSH